MKQGDLVTVLDSGSGQASNVYVIARKLSDESVLFHPIYPECLILRKDSELNQSLAILKNPIEKSLEFVMKHRELLDYNTNIEIESICAFFVIHHKLSSWQKKTISNLSGKVAAIYFENDLAPASKAVVDHEGLLDSYNQMWFSDLKDVFLGKKVPTPKQRVVIFNIAGFVLAQLEVNKISRGKENEGAIPKTE